MLFLRQAGKHLAAPEPLEESRRRTAAELAQLPEYLKQLEMVQRRDRPALRQLNSLIKADLRAPRQFKTTLISAFLTDWTELRVLQADKALSESLTAKRLG